MPHRQLTQINRTEIAVLFRTGMSYKGIGKQIGCHHSTVSRELSQHTWHNPSGYDVIQARKQPAKTRLEANWHIHKLLANGALVAVITTRLKDNQSPDKIASWMRDTKCRVRVCAQIIYDWSC